ncbi:hypothetical protein GCM10007877_01520 [Marinibactrum halimedae]|uniref:Cytochrome c domain-containing protein n=2 Tax=Marinibactrum halimedae TaxID=1444977 RepID=A0AA37WM12_9GAMM|nr:hypothetical protein GCM10007877_01520 [Marinibactrum halimedae]
MGCSFSHDETAVSINRSSVSDKLHQVEQRLYHSGGVVNEKEMCPKTPFDTITPVANLNPPAPTGTPEMTISGVDDFIQQNNITTIDALLKTFPDHYRTNFSLVEHTRATGQSDLEHPRIVLFGSDGRFLLNIGTKPDDPLYNALDVAELNTTTGHWEFSVFDFSQEKPILTRNDPSCNECHGSQNSRPVWGSFQEWTGVFGDSFVDGPRPEALDDTHADKMNRIIFEKDDTPRMDFLLWEPVPLVRGGSRLIARHDFGPELLLSNIAMGSANALGSFLRLSQKQPENYRALRKALVLAYYKKRSEKNRYFVKVNHSKEIWNYSNLMKDKVRKTLSESQAGFNGYDELSLDNLLSSLQLETSEAFSLATLHSTETPNPNWNTTTSDLYDLLMLQVLDDLRSEDTNVDTILAKTKPGYGVFECPDTAATIADLVDFKMLHLFQLAGESRYDVNWVYYPKDVDDIYDQVFLPIAEELIPYLVESSPQA